MKLNCIARRGETHAAVKDRESFDSETDEVYLVNKSNNSVTVKRWQSALRFGYWEECDETITVDDEKVKEADSIASLQKSNSEKPISSVRIEEKGLGDNLRNLARGAGRGIRRGLDRAANLAMTGGEPRDGDGDGKYSIAPGEPDETPMPRKRRWGPRLAERNEQGELVELEGSLWDIVNNRTPRPPRTQEDLPLNGMRMPERDRRPRPPLGDDIWIDRSGNIHPRDDIWDDTGGAPRPDPPIPFEDALDFLDDDERERLIDLWSDDIWDDTGGAPTPGDDIWYDLSGNPHPKDNPNNFELDPQRQPADPFEDMPPPPRRNLFGRPPRERRGQPLPPGDDIWDDGNPNNFLRDSQPQAADPFADMPPPPRRNLVRRPPRERRGQAPAASPPPNDDIWGD